ncbi:hypothetical protein LguiA_023292 [Lonicera macranthoides]
MGLLFIFFFKDESKTIFNNKPIFIPNFKIVSISKLIFIPNLQIQIHLLFIFFFKMNLLFQKWVHYLSSF